jgi:hypothetical protein
LIVDWKSIGSVLMGPWNERRRAPIYAAPSGDPQAQSAGLIDGTIWTRAWSADVRREQEPESSAKPMAEAWHNVTGPLAGPKALTTADKPPQPQTLPANVICKSSHSGQISPLANAPSEADVMLLHWQMIVKIGLSS